MKSANTLDPVNYNNGPKNNWRRTVWNAIHHFTPSPRDALVLYLAGASNMDRDIALRHGFLAGNLIAIERDDHTAGELRRCFKQTVIQTDLFNALHSWPDSHPVGVVLADMTGSIDGDAYRALGSWVSSKSFANSTLAINVMRGRESSSVAKLLLSFDLPDMKKHFNLAPKHRASAVIAALYFFTAMTHFSQPPKPWSHADWAAHWLLDRGLFRQFYSFKFVQGYRSPQSGQVFDTVVVKDNGVSLRGSHDAEADSALLRSIRASMAVRTMRLRGDFQ